jgi:prevent-host-death family protein
MKKLPAGEFKAKCLAIMDQVQATGEPVVITKRGVPVAKIVPAAPADIFGFMAGKFKIVGDIESPAVPLKAWNAARARKS